MPNKKDSTVRLCPGFIGEGYDQEAHKASESAFYVDKARRGGGFSSRCKECHKARCKSYNKKYYVEHKDEIISVVLERRKIAKQAP